MYSHPHVPGWCGHSAQHSQWETKWIATHWRTKTYRVRLFSGTRWYVALSLSLLYYIIIITVFVGTTQTRETGVRVQSYSQGKIYVFFFHPLTDGECTGFKCSWLGNNGYAIYKSERIHCGPLRLAFSRTSEEIVPRHLRSAFWTSW